MKIYVAAGMNSITHVNYIEWYLQKMGHVVISSWPTKHKNTEIGNALQDLDEIEKADCVIFLTFTHSTKGGRYIEQGYALALKRSGQEKRLIICGPKENCFNYLEDFEHYSHIEELVNAFQ